MTYRIIAAIDYLASEDAIYRILEGETIPDQYRSVGPVCEHCGQARIRKTVYILTDGASYRQVGSTCLLAFTGQDEGELVSAFQARLESDEDERVRRSHMIDLESYLADVALEIRTRGWISAGKAYENGEVSTAVWALSSTDRPLPEDVFTARAAIAWAQAIPDNEPNDYLHNLYTIAQFDAIEPKHVNLAASMVVAYQRDAARKAEQARDTAVSRHFGTVGKRETFVLTVERVTPIATEYGITNIHTLRDAAGNVAVWFATRECLDVGKIYALKATVKKHDQYNGIAQTTLTRCAL